MNARWPSIAFASDGPLIPMRNYVLILCHKSIPYLLPLDYIKPSSTESMSVRIKNPSGSMIFPAIAEAATT
jgi:hypothetical protein